MKMGRFLMIGLASLATVGVCNAASMSDMGELYKTRCSNCHGIKADGVPKIKEQEGVNPETANASGMASQKKLDIYGPPLKSLSKQELVSKLKDLRNKDFDSMSAAHHSVMRDNLQKVEERDGKIDDEAMAEYIYKTFGGGM